MLIQVGTFIRDCRVVGVYEKKRYFYQKYLKNHFFYIQKLYFCEMLSPSLVKILKGKRGYFLLLLWFNHYTFFITHLVGQITLWYATKHFLLCFVSEVYWCGIWMALIEKCMPISNFRFKNMISCMEFVCSLSRPHVHEVMLPLDPKVVLWFHQHLLHLWSHY